MSNDKVEHYGTIGQWEPPYDKPLYDDPPPAYEMTLHEAVAAIKELQKEVDMLNAWKAKCCAMGEWHYG